MSPKGTRLASLPPQWGAFLRELDAVLETPVELHCIGGFVMTAFYGMPRLTGDVDYMYAAARGAEQLDLEGLAGAAAALATRHKLHLERVTVANYPEDYDSRLKEIFPGELKKLRLLALDPYDLILTKMDRNSDIDRSDAKFLAQKLKLSAEVLQERYSKELRPNFVGDVDRLDSTLRLWLEAYFEGES